MNKFDYDFIINDIELIERKLKRIQLEKEYLELIKPSFFDFNKRKLWEVKKNKLLNEEKRNNYVILLSYTNLEKLF